MVMGRSTLVLKSNEQVEPSGHTARICRPIFEFVLKRHPSSSTVVHSLLTTFLPWQSLSPACAGAARVSSAAAKIIFLITPSPLPARGARAAATGHLTTSFVELSRFAGGQGHA